MGRPRKDAETEEVAVEDDRYEQPREGQDPNHKDAGQAYVEEQNAG